VICATSSSRFQACLAAPRPGEIASERTRLTTALRGGRTLKYIYDFGDQWEHQIKLEKAWAPDSQIRLPRCIDGAGATPPEDCGGSPGCEDFRPQGLLHVPSV
jgi:hypothetical protein